MCDGFLRRVYSLGLLRTEFPLIDRPAKPGIEQKNGAKQLPQVQLAYPAISRRQRMELSSRKSRAGVSVYFL
jgi:hypothetical protein